MDTALLLDVVDCFTERCVDAEAYLGYLGYSWITVVPYNLDAIHKLVTGRNRLRVIEHEATTDMYISSCGTSSEH